MRILFALLPLVRALEILGTAAEGECIPSGRGTERIINERFRVGESSLSVWFFRVLIDALGVGGEGEVVRLCPGSVHRMQEPVVMTARGQVLETRGGGEGQGRGEGNGEEWGRALLLVEGDEQSMAIK